jgi:ribosomal protein L22
MPAQNASRARKEKDPMVSASLAKVVKKAAQIADLMTGRDVESDLKVLRDAKKATHHVYDTKKKKLVKVPDHKTRLAATTLSRAYHEGKPVERSITLQGDVDDFATMLEKARKSPAFLDSLQKTVLGQEIAPTLHESEIGEH